MIINKLKSNISVIIFFKKKRVMLRSLDIIG